jgi:hypothetical protein
LITRIVRDYDAYVRRNLERGVSAKDLNVGFLKSTEIQVKKQVEGINKIIRDKIKEGESYIKHNWAESTGEILEGVEQSDVLRGFLKLFGGERSVGRLLGVVSPRNSNIQPSDDASEVSGYLSSTESQGSTSNSNSNGGNKKNSKKNSKKKQKIDIK